MGIDITEEAIETGGDYEVEEPFRDADADVGHRAFVFKEMAFVLPEGEKIFEQQE